jgi:hypothetical protein
MQYKIACVCVVMEGGGANRGRAGAGLGVGWGQISEVQWLISQVSTSESIGEVIRWAQG